MAKKNELNWEYDPIKEVPNEQAAAVVWTTNALNKAVEGIQKGLPLKVNPFIGKNTRLLKPDLVYKRTAEEIEDYIRCKEDPIYFAAKCYLMTPEGLQPVVLRDYQVDYLNHLKNNNFSILLSARQSGKTHSFLTKIKVKFDSRIKELEYYYIKDNEYELPQFELHNLFCKQTLMWKLRYNIYKIIFKLEEHGRKTRNENQKSE